MVSHLTGLGDGAPHVSGPLRSEVGDSTAVLAVLVGKQLDTPPLGDSLESLSGGDGDDVDECSLGCEVGDGDLFAEDALGVLDPLFHVSTADPELHEVGDLLGNSGDQLGLGVCEDTDVLDIHVVELSEVGLSPLRDVDPSLEEGVHICVCRPYLAGGLESENGVLVEPDGRDLHGRDLDDCHRHLYFHSGGGALCSLVDYERVGHSCLVSGESLDLRGSADLGPGV